MDTFLHNTLKHRPNRIIFHRKQLSDENLVSHQNERRYHDDLLALGKHPLMNKTKKRFYCLKKQLVVIVRHEN